MKINANSQENMRIFSENSDKYLLAVHQDKNKEVSINLMKKGIVTWVKIHIGGVLGLFDSTSVKMQHVSSILSRVQTRDENFANFNRAFLAKKIKFEKKHYPLFTPFEKTLNAQESTHLKDESTLTQSKKIENHLKDVCPEQFSSVNIQEKGNELWISLELSSLSSSKIKKDLEKISSENILNAILLGEGECVKDVERAAQRGYKQILIQFSSKDTLCAKIFADIDFTR
ncbi:hypothetical protein PHSC3_000382 [Chlamydiales bacterium STE3]|nr:hypothetical protein PHSC3_000382 [Chlamydiales bacterium STE3]